MADLPPGDRSGRSCTGFATAFTVFSLEILTKPRFFALGSLQAAEDAVTAVIEQVFRTRLIISRGGTRSITTFQRSVGQMRAQRRRFVVEVKRGTSRASFISMDPAAEKFSSAEDALFGPRETRAAQPSSVPSPKAPPPAGRILRDLHEPPPPPPSEAPPPARRGRKPGSKNKPKPVLVMLPDLAAAPARHRPAWADAVAAHPAVPDPAPVAAPLAAPAPAESRLPRQSRQRLRDRSSILKRYVLGTEPAPGQPGWVRGLRSKRQRG